MKIRPATPEDAPDLAVLINLAGDGLPVYQWWQMAGHGQDALHVGALRAAREEGPFSYRNSRIVEADGQVGGMVLSYQLQEPYDMGDLDRLPVVIRPLVELEARTAGSWYVNAIATHEPFRGRGLATALMKDCEALARAAGAEKLSLIVAAENERACRLYMKLGFREIASRPLCAYPGGPQGGDWLLMVKELN